MKPRIPGSQVAPNDRPLFTDGHTASTHSKVPIAQASAGKLYRVRDKIVAGDVPVIWGDNLSFDQASKLKEAVVSSGRSKTARYETMDTPLPFQAIQASLGHEVEPPEPAQPTERIAFDLASSDPVTVPSRGAIRSIPDGTQLVVNGAPMALPAAVAAGDIVQAMPLDPNAVQVRRAPVPKPAPERVKYRDTTVRAPIPRKGPAPRDKTKSKEPVLVRLGAPETAPAQPLESPLAAAVRADGAPLPEHAIGDDDILDIASDLGGGATQADIEHAGRQHGA